MLEGEDAGSEGAEEVAVVADEEDGACEFLEGFEQDFAGLDIEVVCGFVEDEEVEGADEHHGEDNAAFFATREDGDGFIDVIFAKHKGSAEFADDANCPVGHDVEDGLKDSFLGVKDIHSVLAEVTKADVGSEDGATFGRFGLLGEDFKEGRFSCAVDTDDSDFFAALDESIDAAKDGIFATVGVLPDLAESVDLDHFVAAAWGRGKTKADGFLFGRDLDTFDLIELFDAGLDLCGVGGAGFEACDKVFFFGNHLLLSLCAGDEIFSADGALFQVKIVIAAIHRNRLVIDFRDGGDAAVHEFAVVACHHKRALELVCQPVFKPDDRFDIEVVGGFVEQQNIGIEDEDTGKRDTHLPTTAEGFDRAMEGIGADPKAGENLLGAVVEVVAAFLCKGFGGIAVAGEQSLHCIRIHRLAHRLFHRFDLFAQLQQIGQNSANFLKRRASRHLADVLGEITHHGFFADADLPFIGLFFPYDEAKDRRLACAIGTYEANAVIRKDLKVGIAKKDLCAVTDADVAKMDHGLICSIGLVVWGMAADG